MTKHKQEELWGSYIQLKNLPYSIHIDTIFMLTIGFDFPIRISDIRRFILDNE